MIKLPFSDGSGEYLLNPSKIVALGLNYHAHINESVSINVRGGAKDVPVEPVLFSKASSCLIGSGEEIVIPAALTEYDFHKNGEDRTDYEAELAFIVKDECKDVPADEAFSHILGYTCFNDVSQRNLQTGDKAGWFRGKSLDTYGPVGPVVVKAEGFDPQNLNICCRKNGEIVQEANTSMMIFKIPEILAFVSRWFTLNPGDLIVTGTPAGVGPLSDGDEVEVEIEKIGTLKNRVVVQK